MKSARIEIRRTANLQPQSANFKTYGSSTTVAPDVPECGFSDLREVLLVVSRLRVTSVHLCHSQAFI